MVVRGALHTKTTKKNKEKKEAKKTVYNARKGFHNATGGNVTQTEWNEDRP